jgi:hypothetical protein
MKSSRLRWFKHAKVMIGKNRMDGRTTPKMAIAPYASRLANLDVLPANYGTRSNSVPATTRLQRTLPSIVKALALMPDADPALQSSLNHPFQCQCIPHRIPAGHRC